MIKKVSCRQNTKLMDKVYTLSVNIIQKTVINGVGVEVWKE